MLREPASHPLQRAFALDDGAIFARRRDRGKLSMDPGGSSTRPGQAAVCYLDSPHPSVFDSAHSRMPTTARPRILWYKARMPGAVGDGSSFASLNLARCLSDCFDLDLLTLELTGRERSLHQHMALPFQSVTVVKPANAGSMLRRVGYRVIYGLRALLRGMPRAALYEDSPGVRAALFRLLSEHAYALVVFEYWTSGGLIPLAGQVPSVLILHDVAHHALQQEAAASGSRWNQRRLVARAEKLMAFELRAAADADSVIVLSEADRMEFSRLGVRNISHLPLVLPPIERQEAPALRSSEVVFLGSLAHAPNKDAISWFVRRVWPLVRAGHPEAVLRVIGGPVTEELRSELEAPGIQLLGFVPDLEAALKTAALGVVPMRQGTGTKTKVLDMMWRGLPLVATRQACPGTPAGDGTVLLGDTAEELAGATLHLLGSLASRLALREAAWGVLQEQHCGEAARQRVQGAFLSAMRGAPSP